MIDPLEPLELFRRETFIVFSVFARSWDDAIATRQHCQREFGQLPTSVRLEAGYRPPPDPLYACAGGQ